MATSTLISTVQQSTNAQFRAWISDVISQLTAVGLTQTSDTGQINTSTVTIPSSASTSAGYTIWKFNDTLQSTSPIFIKLEFGTGSSGTSNPLMWATVGLGTNGAGTINSTGISTRLSLGGGLVPSSATNFTSRFCYNETYGFLGFFWQIGAYGSSYPNAALMALIVCRSTDTSGNSTGTAYQMIGYANDSLESNNYGYSVLYNYDANATYPSSASSAIWSVPTCNANWTAYWPCMVPSNDSSGNLQVVPTSMWYGTYQFNPNLIVGWESEISTGTTISTTVMGTAARTYLSVGVTHPGGYAALTANGGATASQCTLCMLWQ